VKFNKWWLISAVLILCFPILKPGLVLANEKIKFGVIGDFGTAGANEAAVANLVKSWNPDFIITTGDDNYSSGAASTIDANIGQYYHDYIYPYKGKYGAGAVTNRFFPSLGNHDYKAVKAQPYIDYFTLPGNERYYDFVKGPVHFFAIDSDNNEPDGNTATSVQANWLKSRLAASTSQWNIVYFHHPSYSSGANHGSSVYMRWPFKEWGVDIVMNGHDHEYERLTVDGVTYIVNGTGGADLYKFGTPLSGSQVRYNATHGAMLVEADENNVLLKFINKQGVTMDSYSMASVRNQPTITKAPTLIPTVVVGSCPKLRLGGDANCDGLIDIGDYSLWYKQFYDGGVGKIIKSMWEADFTGTNGTPDNKVDVYDYSLWYKKFQETFKFK